MVTGDVFILQQGINMTIYYSKSTNSFYDPSINEEIPSDKVEISFETWQSLLKGQGQGKAINSDKSGNPILVDPPKPTKEDLIPQYEFAAQSNLDAVAKSWGYDSLAIAASYANSTNAQFKAEAETLIAWRDNYWSEAYTIESGTLPATAEAFVAALPAAPSKPTV